MKALFLLLVRALLLVQQYLVVQMLLLKPYFFLITSSIILVVGFTTIIELIHSFNLNKEYTYAYWIKLDNYNFFTWLIFTLFTITGLILCRRHFIKTKAIWNEIMEEIKIELKQ